MKKSTGTLVLFALGSLAAVAQSGRPEPSGIAKDVLHRLDVAWNAADAKSFAAEFTDDADVVNIFGSHFRGRVDLTKRMQQIFDTIFKGSTHRSRTLERAYYLGDDVVVAISAATVAVSSGPMAPVAENRQTFILVDRGGRWQIRHWHNTPVRTP
jgi:uncharacterized protein (TIGR02246 family)